MSRLLAELDIDQRIQRRWIVAVSIAAIVNAAAVLLDTAVALTK